MQIVPIIRFINGVPFFDLVAIGTLPKAPGQPTTKSELLEKLKRNWQYN